MSLCVCIDLILSYGGWCFYLLDASVMLMFSVFPCVCWYRASLIKRTVYKADTR